MEPYESLLLRGGADRERMPLILGYSRYLDKDVVAWLIGEVSWSSEHQMQNLNKSTMIIAFISMAVSYLSELVINSLKLMEAN